MTYDIEAIKTELQLRDMFQSNSFFQFVGITILFNFEQKLSLANFLHLQNF